MPGRGSVRRFGRVESGFLLSGCSTLSVAVGPEDTDDDSVIGRPDWLGPLEIDAPTDVDAQAAEGPANGDSWARARCARSSLWRPSLLYGKPFEHRATSICQDIDNDAHAVIIKLMSIPLALVQKRTTEVDGRNGSAYESSVEVEDVE